MELKMSSRLFVILSPSVLLAGEWVRCLLCIWFVWCICVHDLRNDTNHTFLSSFSKLQSSIFFTGRQTFILFRNRTKRISAGCNQCISGIMLLHSHSPRRFGSLPKLTSPKSRLSSWTLLQWRPVSFWPLNWFTWVNCVFCVGRRIFWISYWFFTIRDCCWSPRLATRSWRRIEWGHGRTLGSLIDWGRG